MRAKALHTNATRRVTPSHLGGRRGAVAHVDSNEPRGAERRDGNVQRLVGTHEESRCQQTVLRRLRAASNHACGSLAPRYARRWTRPACRVRSSSCVRPRARASSGVSGAIERTTDAFPASASEIPSNCAGPGESARGDANFFVAHENGETMALGEGACRDHEATRDRGGVEPVAAPVFREATRDELRRCREDEKRGFVDDVRGFRVAAALRVFADLGEGSGFKAFDRASRERGTNGSRRSTSAPASIGRGGRRPRERPVARLDLRGAFWIIRSDPMSCATLSA